MGGWLGAGGGLPGGGGLGCAVDAGSDVFSEARCRVAYERSQSGMARLRLSWSRRGTLSNRSHWASCSLGPAGFSACARRMVLRLGSAHGKSREAWAWLVS